MEKLKDKRLTNRIVLFVLALFVVSLGVSLTTRANLGTSPAACPPYVLSLAPQLPLTMGTYMFAMQVMFVLAQIALLRSRFEKLQLFQFVASFLFGLYTDITMWLTTPFIYENYAMQWVVLLIGCSVMAFGIALELKAALLLLPGEGLVKAISQVGGWKFPNVKIWNDVVMTMVGSLLSVALIGSFEGVREGTVVSALLTGFMVKVFMPYCSGLDRWVKPQIGMLATNYKE